MNGEPAHKTWLRFKRVLLQYFHKSLDVVHKGLIDRLVRSSIVKQPFVQESRLLDEMININQAWYTSEDYVSFPHLGMLKAQEEKNQEREKNIAKLTGQLEMLFERVIRAGENSVNAMSRRVHNDGAYMRGEKSKGFQTSYPRLVGNQGWTKNSDGWYEREYEDDIIYMLIQ
ncbi:hypothetical protein MTR67_022848 [Solanum verrucosum]|uniref:Uncharacterized protein n=1 Tax=Solanum verrucosum TaxID=315347 RepID=A0AAF0QW21_SOLVR|nr:hypothetical protein MTR67_022848 [Solanum verrucosum]